MLGFMWHEYKTCCAPSSSVITKILCLLSGLQNTDWSTHFTVALLVTYNYFITGLEAEIQEEVTVKRTPFPSIYTIWEKKCIQKVNNHRKTLIVSATFWKVCVQFKNSQKVDVCSFTNKIFLEIFLRISVEIKSQSQKYFL